MENKIPWNHSGDNKPLTTKEFFNHFLVFKDGMIAKYSMPMWIAEIKGNSLTELGKIEEVGYTRGALNLATYTLILTDDEGVEMRCINNLPLLDLYPFPKYANGTNNAPIGAECLVGDYDINNIAAVNVNAKITTGIDINSMKDMQISCGEWRKKDNGIEINLDHPDTLKDKGLTEHPDAKDYPSIKREMPPPSRLPGFYWIEYQESWTIAEYDCGLTFRNGKWEAIGEVEAFWYFHGGGARFYDHEFTKIDERPIMYDHKLD